MIFIQCNENFLNAAQIVSFNMEFSGGVFRYEIKMSNGSEFSMDDPDEMIAFEEELGIEPVPGYRD